MAGQKYSPSFSKVLLTIVFVLFGLLLIPAIRLNPSRTGTGLNRTLSKQYFTNQKGQGSLEYLLIIGGGILVAVIIIGSLITLTGAGTGGSKANIANQTCNTNLSAIRCATVLHATIAASTASADWVNCANGPTVPANTDLNACCFTSAAAVGTRCTANLYNKYP